jgi:FSR family fosmidomycin resistance protein-like MFS transporter
MTLLLDALFSSVALGHFAVDLLNGQRAVLLTFLSGRLGLSNTLLGFFSTVYVVSGALFQPVFGFIADRIGVRWVIVGGVLWIATFFSLALITPGITALWLLALASLGSAAFHPAGTMQATLRGRTFYTGRETTSASIFFLFGQTGNFMGPVVAGPVLDRFGLSGLIWLAVFVGFAGLNAARQLSPTAEFKPLISPPKGNAAEHNSGNGWRKRALPFIAFALVAAFQAWSQQNITTFMPKYLSDLGLSASVYGLVSATFVGGSAIGGTIGGSLADRFGKRRIAATSLALASIPLFLVSRLGWSPWYYLLIPLAGGLTGAVHSILVVLAQRAIPGGIALASGLILGFMFTSGALGTLLCGYLADQWGFPPVFQLTAGIALAASVLALTLRKN